jgi:hypothetical protein
MIAYVTTDYSVMGQRPAIYCWIASQVSILVMDKPVTKTLIVALSVEMEFVKKPMENIAVTVHKTVPVMVSKENAVAMEYAKSLKIKEAPARKIVDKTV